jgi:hypothetical protein
LVAGPVFAMHGLNAAGVGANPRDRVRARGHAGTDVELQDDRGLGVLCQKLRRALALDGRESGW